MFDPSFLVKLFTERLNDSEDSKTILANLALCIEPTSYCSCGCGSPYFVDSKSPEWKLKTSVSVCHNNTLYVIDIMEDLTIGSIEILDDFPMSMEDMTEVQVE